VRKAGVRVGGRGVAVVAAPRAVEVAAGVAPAVGWWLVLITLGPEALQAGPGLDQGPVDREVFAAQKLPHPRLVHNRRQELGRDVALEQAVAVGRERGRVPHRIVDPQPHEPTEQQVVVQLLH
jgi:hypothetical protein